MQVIFWLKWVYTDTEIKLFTNGFDVYTPKKRHPDGIGDA